jgi:diaminohydroxyphosphoribosylaminopyrimidine deaminase / 5-amino-6-(5-phosphoribosylamino)uracil reductase
MHNKTPFSNIFLSPALALPMNPLSSPEDHPTQRPHAVALTQGEHQPVRLSQTDLSVSWDQLLDLNNPSQFVIGQLGQSLDGRVATPTGESKYINGQAGLLHLHRLRSMVDAVVIGVKTAEVDDPLLTVRLLEGAHPARVVIDPKGTLSPDAKVWLNDGVRRIVITEDGVEPRCPQGVEHVTIAWDGHHLAPSKILHCLSELGLQRILIEGGPDTLARFINAKCLQRLHLIVAPIILGSGKQGINLEAITSLSQAIFPQVKYYALGDEILIDCHFQSL